MATDEDPRDVLRSIAYGSDPRIAPGDRVRAIEPFVGPRATVTPEPRNEAYYLEREGMSIASSSEAAYTPDGSTWISAFQSYQTLFRPIMRHDFQLRRPNFWVVSTGWLV